MMQLRQDGLTWHVAGGDVVVLDLEGSVYLKLNGSARVLWERLAEPCNEAELIAALVERYGIEEERAAADVGGFLADLRQRNLLVD
jgi:Coenzyme PQQ synthesis protein D (PqqD)